VPNRLRYPLAERPPGYAIHKASEPTIPNDPAAPDTNNPMTASAASPHRERDTQGESRAAKGRVGRRWRTELEKAEELVGGKGGLTLKQRMFCREYLVQKGNATQAVIAAGYKANNASIEELIGKHIGMFIERSLNVSVSASSAHLEALLEVARRRSEPKDITNQSDG